MATTTNFGWETPDDTDLVKDGAAAIRTALGGVDTSFVDLKGGTTGQVLSKASNTDLDYTWVTTDDANAIQNSIVDAKGDIITATANDTPARLAAGTQNQVLAVDTSSATGLTWQGGAWVTWSPTINNLTIGNGTIAARYRQIGNLVSFSIKVTFGSTTTIAASPNISMGVASNSPSVFPVYILDAGTAAYAAAAYFPTGTTMFLDLIDTTSSRASLAAFSSTSPFTWGTGDFFSVSGSYEVA